MNGATLGGFALSPALFSAFSTLMLILGSNVALRR